MSRDLHILRAALAVLVITAFALPASAAIPDSERATLLALYNSTNGANWTDNSGWGDVSGTECSWHGITCNDDGDHVIGIQLDRNNLVGTLPELSGLVSLQIFVVERNGLTGPMPALSGLKALRIFDASVNQLTGSIPYLSGLTSLYAFDVSANELSGTIPDLSGLTSLQYFYAGGNQLTGSIPDLSELTSLKWFFLYDNQLIGMIPNLSDLTSLEILRVKGNQLTGTPPAAPSGLISGISDLCPNFLHTPSPTDMAWDIATGETPWSQNCTPGYLVTPMAGMGGSITPALPHAVVSGATDTLTITPNSGYAVQYVGGSCGGTFDNGDGSYLTLPITQDCTVTATFYLVADEIFRDGFDS